MHYKVKNSQKKQIKKNKKSLVKAEEDLPEKATEWQLVRRV
jgi:hypothetical protein